MTVRLLSIIVFGVFLFGGIDDFIVEKYVGAEEQLVKQSFVDSSVRQGFIDEWNRWFCQSSTHVEDITLKDGNFVFHSPKNYVDESSSSYMILPKTDESMIYKYVEQLTKETTQLGLAILFPFIISVLNSFTNIVLRKSLKNKRIIFVKEMFVLISAVLLSLQGFYCLVVFFVKDWNTSALTVPIILMIFSLLDFIKKRIFELDDKEKL